MVFFLYVQSIGLWLRLLQILSALMFKYVVKSSFFHTSETSYTYNLRQIRPKILWNLGRLAVLQWHQQCNLFHGAFLKAHFCGYRKLCPSTRTVFMLHFYALLQMIGNTLNFYHTSSALTAIIGTSTSYVKRCKCQLWDTMPSTFINIVNTSKVWSTKIAPSCTSLFQFSAHFIVAIYFQ